MIIPVLSQYDTIEVVWIDTQTPKHGGWFGKPEYDAFKSNLLVMRTVSLYLDHDDDYFRVCGTVDTDDGEMICLIAIPVGCIKEIYKLRRE